MLGVDRDQLGDGVGPGAPAILLVVPRGRRDLGEEPLQLVRVVDELPVEVPRVPVDQDRAEIEHDGRRRRHESIVWSP